MAAAHREGRDCWAWPGPRGRRGRARRRVSGVLVLVTPSCLGDSQRRAVGASRWRDVFAQPVAPGEVGGGGAEVGRGEAAGHGWRWGGGWQGWGRGTCQGV